MMFAYSRCLISDEDYYRLSRPKKIMFAFMACYTSVGIGIWAVKQKNPEIYYKKLLISPFLLPLMSVILPTAVFLYFKKQREVTQDIYKRTVGHLSDKQMLELEIKINPHRKLIYEQILAQADKDESQKQAQQTTT